MDTFYYVIKTVAKLRRKKNKIFFFFYKNTAPLVSEQKPLNKGGENGEISVFFLTINTKAVCVVNTVESMR